VTSAPNETKPQLQLKSQKFREAREKDWKALARQIERAENGGLGRFTTEELLELPVLYRSSVSSLSMAQSISLDRNLIGYLQALCGRAYVYMYGPHARPGVVARQFFVHDLPRAVRTLWAETALAFMCLVMGIAGGILMCVTDPSWYNPLVGGSAQGRDLNASTEQLRETIGGAQMHEPLAAFSVFLMSHNTQVTLLAFALGVIGGLPTAFITIVFGMSVGAMIWLFATHGLGAEFVAWLAIHGTTELSAVVIGAAAGFHLGRRILFPGALTRRAALAQSGGLGARPSPGRGRGSPLAASCWPCGSAIMCGWGVRARGLRRRRMAKAEAWKQKAAAGMADEPQTTVVTPEGVALSFRTASFGARVGALMLDYLIMTLAPLALILLFIILPFEHIDLKGVEMNHPFVQAMFILFILLAFFLRSGYFMFFEMGPRAATPGKRLMKIRVISHDGGHLTPSAVITRNALREVEFYLPLTLMGQSVSGGGWIALLALVWTLLLALLPVFNRSRARLGDFLGGTRVVYVPKAALGFDLAEQVVVAPSLIFTPEQVGVYGEKELGVLEEVLRERRNPTLLAVADRIKARIGWVAPANATDMPTDEAFLRAYYAALRAHLEGRLLMGRRRKDKFET